MTPKSLKAHAQIANFTQLTDLIKQYKNLIDLIKTELQMRDEKTQESRYFLFTYMNRVFPKSHRLNLLILSNFPVSFRDETCVRPRRSFSLDFLTHVNIIRHILDI